MRLLKMVNEKFKPQKNWEEKWDRSHKNKKKLKKNQ